MMFYFSDEIDKIDAAVQTEGIVGVEEYYPADDRPDNPLEE